MFNVFVSQTVESELLYLLSEPDQFADFTYLGFLTTQNSNVTAIAVFMAWIKLFKYLTFNKTMKQLTRTLSRVSWKVPSYLVRNWRYLAWNISL